MENFIDRESLLAGVGEAVLWLDEEKKVLYEHNTHEVDAYHGFTPTTPLYTADQLAAAVAIEREKVEKFESALEDLMFHVEEAMRNEPQPYEIEKAYERCAAAIRGQR